MAIELGWGPTYTSSTDDHGVGAIKWDSDGNAYRWVEVVDLDLAVGDVVYPASTSTWQVTQDIAGGSRLTALVCGVAVVAVDISEAKYAFVQVEGICPDVLGDGAVAAGEAVVGHIDSGADGAADAMAAGEEAAVFGYALEADSGSPTTFACQLKGII